MDSEKILEAEEKDAGPSASCSGTTEVTEHFGALEKVKVRHAEPSSKKAQKLSSLIIKKKENHPAGLDTIADHFAFMSEETIKLLSRDRVPIARAGVAEQKVEGQNARSDAKGNKLFNTAINVVINMMVVGGRLS